MFKHTFAANIWFDRQIIQIENDNSRDQQDRG